MTEFDEELLKRLDLRMFLSGETTKNDEHRKQKCKATSNTSNTDDASNNWTENKVDPVTSIPKTETVNYVYRHNTTDITPESLLNCLRDEKVRAELKSIVMEAEDDMVKSIFKTIKNLFTR